MPKITHFHFETTKNIGDEAHVLAIRDMIQEQYDGFVEFVSLPIEFLKYHQVPPVVPGHAALPGVAHRAYRYVKQRSIPALLREVNRSDVVVIGGGGVYIAPLLPFDTRLLQGITAPVVVYGAGYNQNTGVGGLDAAQRHSVQVLGGKARLQSVRDEGTRTFLRDLGVDCELAGDPAVFLEPIPAENIKKSPGTVAVGLNIAAHGWSKQAELLPKLVAAYAGFAKQFAKTHNAAFYYCMHYPDEQKVVDMLCAQGVPIKQVVQGRSRNLKGAYEQMDFVVAMMLHASILAFGAGTPVVSVGYDVKNQSFMELTGQHGRYVAVDAVTPGFLAEQAAKLCEDRVAVRADLHKRRAPMRRKAVAFAQSVAALLPS